MSTKDLFAIGIYVLSQHVYKHGYNNNNNHYYKILFNILLSRLTPYAEEIIGDHQCGCRRNRSATDHILCIRQILEKKLE